MYTSLLATANQYVVPNYIGPILTELGSNWLQVIWIM